MSAVNIVNAFSDSELIRELRFRLIEHYELDKLPLITQKHIEDLLDRFENYDEITSDKLNESEATNAQLEEQIQSLTSKLALAQGKQYHWSHNSKEYVKTVQRNIHDINLQVKHAARELTKLHEMIYFTKQIVFVENQEVNND